MSSGFEEIKVGFLNLSRPRHQKSAFFSYCGCLLEVTRNINQNVLFPSLVVTFRLPSASLFSLCVSLFFLGHLPRLFAFFLSSAPLFLHHPHFSLLLFHLLNLPCSISFVFILFCFPTSSSAVFCRIQLLRRRIHTYSYFTHTSQINSTQHSATFRCFLDNLMILIQ